MCSILDIPVYENPVESLHVLFTLYLEFKHNPIFSQHVAGALLLVPVVGTGYTYCV